MAHQKSDRNKFYSTQNCNMTPYESIKHNNLWAMKINTRFKLPLVAITISANMFFKVRGIER